MQQTQLAETTEVAGITELSLEPRQAQPVALVRDMPSARDVTPADLLRIATQSGDQDIARLERLMAMDIQFRERNAIDRQREREWQEQDRRRDAELAFRESFAAFRGENIVIPHSKHVDRGNAGSFEQAEYHRVTGMLSPALSKHGYGFRHDPKFGSRKWTNADGVETDIPWVTVTCWLEHAKGHRESVTLEGPISDLRGNTQQQNMQATASYLKRHTLLAITGTATGGEDDENKLKAAPTSDVEPSTEVGRKIELQNTGDAAAAKGMAALTAWWATLGAREQKDMSSFFGAMRKTARQVDEGGAR